MELHIKIVGVLFIVLALIHAIFPKYFEWKTQLTGLSLVNRQMMQIHALFIALVVFLMGVLCLTSSHELTGSTFGRRISLGLGIFWFARLIVQLFVYSPELWKGKKFETTIHILFTAVWIYVSSVFLINWVSLFF